MRLSIVSSYFVIGSTILSTTLFSTSCTSRTSIQKMSDSGVSATSQDQAGQQLRCGVIYPSVKSVSIPIFRRIAEVARTGNASPEAVTLARQTMQMLANMSRHPQNPIHPLGFFSVVKDFESSADIDSWGQNGFKFTTENCTSGKCSGYFQVDVNIEPTWRDGAICQSKGLNIWSMKGGPDFCAALYWWIQAEGGAKCERLASGNPCKDPNYTWSVPTFSRGYEAYVQEPQWGRDSWGKMYQGEESYKGYKQCIESAENAPMLVAVERFFADIGSTSSKSACKNLQIYATDKTGFVQFQVNKPPECGATKIRLFMHGKKQTNWAQVAAVAGDGISGNKTVEHIFTDSKLRFSLPHDELTGVAPEIKIVTQKNSDVFAEVVHPFKTSILDCSQVASSIKETSTGIQFKVEFSQECPATKIFIHLKDANGKWVMTSVHPGDSTVAPKGQHALLEDKIARFFIPKADLAKIPERSILIIPGTFVDVSKGEERFGELVRSF